MAVGAILFGAILPFTNWLNTGAINASALSSVPAQSTVSAAVAARK